jgi:SPX domain protein involved in polyphosphate accumulation
MISMEEKAVGEFISFCQELDALRKYVVWNYVGVLKILKKCAKTTAFDVRQLVLGTLTSKSFYRTVVPATLYTEAQVRPLFFFFFYNNSKKKRGEKKDSF